MILTREGKRYFDNVTVYQLHDKDGSGEFYVTQGADPTGQLHVYHFEKPIEGLNDLSPFDALHEVTDEKTANFCCKAATWRLMGG